MDDWASLCDEACKPCLEQAEYILQTNDDNKHVIFENAVLHDNSAVIDLDTKREKLGGRARMQLKPSGGSTTCGQCDWRDTLVRTPLNRLSWTKMHNFARD